MRYSIEWLNTMTGRLRVSRVKVDGRPGDWRELLRRKHNMVTVLDIHILNVERLDPPKCEGHYDDDVALLTCGTGDAYYCDGSCEA